MIRLFGVIILMSMGCIACTEESPQYIVTATQPDLNIITEPTTATEAQNVAIQATTPPTATSVFSSPQPPAFDCSTDALAKPQYIVEATLSWANKTVDVVQTVRYSNQTELELTQLEFYIEGNRQIGFFNLADIVDENGHMPEGVSLDNSRLVIPLRAPLPPQCTTAFQLTFTQRIPPIVDDYFGRFGYLGYTDRQINLGHWLPILGIRLNNDWAVPRAHFIGEQAITITSDFDVTLAIEDAPPTITVAAPGRVQIVGDKIWQLSLESARDLTVSIGNGFRRTSQLAENGTIIELYFFPETANANPFDSPSFALQAAAQALVLYEERFGLAYPYERLVIVEGDFPDGMEFSGLAFVGEAWFRIWDGSPNSWLTVITVHEVSHQWWYTLVGSNPASYPYMDEAFATYSEYLFFEEFFPEHGEWWWNFRVGSYPTDSGAVEADIYAYDNGRPYINVAYLRGAQMLHTMRTDLGDEAFFAWLRTYASDFEYDIASHQDLWTVLPVDLYTASQPVRQRFFGNWQILPIALPTATP